MDFPGREPGGSGGEVTLAVGGVLDGEDATAPTSHGSPPWLALRQTAIIFFLEANNNVNHFPREDSYREYRNHAADHS